MIYYEDFSRIRNPPDPVQASGRTCESYCSCYNREALSAVSFLLTSESGQVFPALQTSFHAVSQGPRLFPSCGSSLHALGRTLSISPWARERKGEISEVFMDQTWEEHTSLLLTKFGHHLVTWSYLPTREPGKCSLCPAGKGTWFWENSWESLLRIFFFLPFPASFIEWFHCHWPFKWKTTTKIEEYGLEM